MSSSLIPEWPEKSEIEVIAEVREESEDMKKLVDHYSKESVQHNDIKLLRALSHMLDLEKQRRCQEIELIAAAHEHSEAIHHNDAKKDSIHHDDSKLLHALSHVLDEERSRTDGHIQKIAAVHDQSNAQHHDQHYHAPPRDFTIRHDDSKLFKAIVRLYEEEKAGHAVTDIELIAACHDDSLAKRSGGEKSHAPKQHYNDTKLFKALHHLVEEEKAAQAVIDGIN